MKKHLLFILLISLCACSHAQTIVMDTFSGSLCAGETFWVHISTTGTFPPNNYFIVECSDIFGNYYGLWLSSPTYGSPDSISCTVFPQYFPTTASGYRIRVLNTGATINADSSNDNGSTLTIYAQPAAPFLSISGHGCIGSDSITVSGAGGGTITWDLYGDSAFRSADTPYIPQSSGSYTATYVTSAATGSCTSALSNAVTVNTNQASVLIAVAADGCHGAPVTYHASVTNGGTSPSYQWYLDGSPVGPDSSLYTNATAYSTDSISVVVVSSAVCVTDTLHGTIAAGVYPVPAAPVLAASGHGCLGADSLHLSASQLSGLTWYEGGIAIDSILGAYTVAGGNGLGTAANQFYSPYSVYVDRAGYIYVSDLFNARVEKFPPNSTSMTDGVTVAANGLSIPLGIFVDGSGNLYVADVARGAVFKFAAGSDSTTAGVVVAGDPNISNSPPAANTLNSPISVYVDGSGNIYVGDAGNSRVQRFAAGSDSLSAGVTVAQHGIYAEGGVYLDPAGNVYVSDDGPNLVWRFAAGSDSGTVGTIAAAHGLSSPVGIYVDGSDNLYVADQGNNRIQKFAAGSDSSTVGQTVAGGPAAGSGPGQLSAPVAVYVDSSGNIYVCDDGNLRVQKFMQSAIDTSYLPASAGSYTVTYISVNGCTSALSDSVIISAPPQVSLSLQSLVAGNYLGGFDDTIWCPEYHPSIFPLSGGAPTGGVYSGTFISNDTINFPLGFSPSGEDTLYYTYTNTAGCSATVADSFIVTICEGIHDIPADGTISLYPNPNTGSFVLQTTDATGQQYTIIDMLGRIVAQEVIGSSSQSISLSGITTGSYTLRVSGGRAIQFTVGQ
jgi:sugar lactone lactonase YvrE